ncbi:MAG: DUF4143 domain-containing protein [Dermatophilaceae bacterium]|nr:DUF4143 domain-containing protein [Dermatophilaceae bacterium]
MSLRKLFDGDFTPSPDPGVTVPAIVNCIVTGGWPALLEVPLRAAQRWISDYVRTIVDVDMPQLGVRRDPGTLRRLRASLGRGTGTDKATQAIVNDIAGSGRTVQRDTVSGFLDILNRLMITEEVPAWAPHMRSTTPLRKSPTRFMTDASLGVAALGVGPERLLLNLNATGFHFEGLVMRDLRVYTQPKGGRLSHWRDNNQHEVDIIITVDDGRWGAIEVNTDPDAVDGAAASLLRFKDKVDTAEIGEPAFLSVATTRSAALRRGDGVYVLPVASLGPWGAQHSRRGITGSRINHPERQRPRRARHSAACRTSRDGSLRHGAPSQKVFLVGADYGAEQLWLCRPSAQTSGGPSTGRTPYRRLISKSGASWSMIGVQLGISRQGAQQRFTRASTREADQRNPFLTPRPEPKFM